MQELARTDSRVGDLIRNNGNLNPSAIVLGAGGTFGDFETAVSTEQGNIRRNENNIRSAKRTMATRIRGLADNEANHPDRITPDDLRSMGKDKG